MVQANMYGDAICPPQLMVGCDHQCKYCKDSFQKQMKRQKKRCEKCYTFEPHWHEERYLKYLKTIPKTTGDQFIWLSRATDVAFAKPQWMQKMIALAEIWRDRTFLFQTKDPYRAFTGYKFPDNCVLAITLETNRNENYSLISKAPRPSLRASDFGEIEHSRKFVTIEPILDFNLEIFLSWIKDICPERVYIGYDSKDTGLLEPSLKKTKQLIKQIESFTRVKPKLLREQRVYIECSNCGKTLTFHNPKEAVICCSRMYFLEEVKQRTLDCFVKNNNEEPVRE